MTVGLRGMTWDHPRAYDCLLAASAEHQRRTGVPIHWEKRSLQAFADVPIESLAREYDLIILDHPHVGQIAETGCLLPLNPMDKETSLGGSAESYIWNDRTWALPIDAACQMSVIRPDLSIGFPSTWNSILEEGAEAYRLVTPLLPVDAFDMMMTLLASLGEDELGALDNQFCSDGNGILSLAVLKRLYKLGPGESVTWNPIMVLEALSTTDEFHASPCLFGYINYSKPDFRPHRLAYVDLPVFEDVGRRRAILGGAGIGVSALRERREAATSFAKWVTSQDAQSGVYLENNGQPAHLQAWLANQSDPRFSPFLRGGFETMRSAWTRPRDPWFLPFVDEICEVITGFFTSDLAAEAFLSTINKIYVHHKQGRAA